MKFWDTSAVVPLLVDEPATVAVRALLEGDGAMVVWWGTRIECVSALARQRREDHLSPIDERSARRNLTSLSECWVEVLASEAIRKRAERLLATHPLRAADAVQLAAALLWCRGESTTHSLVSFDERLRDAAAREGFSVLPE